MNQRKNNHKIDCHAQSSSAVKKQGRCTNSEYEQRIKAVFDLLLQSKNRAEILEYAGKIWGVGRASADLLIHEATQRIIEICDAEKEAAYARAVLQLEQMLSQCFELGDLKTALSVRRELSELQRLKESAPTFVMNASNLVLSAEDRDLL